MIKILDCTLRDGGYYTNWDFERNIVDQYITGINILPIDYIEVGYRNTSSENYLGEYGYCPTYRLREIKAMTKKKIAVMLNEKEVNIADLKVLTEPIIGVVDMIRMAIDPKNIERAITLSIALKDQGFEVGFNLMYMSKWNETDLYTDSLKKVNEVADLFCMVDSFGSMTPLMVAETIDKVKQFITIPMGFHAHNNLELALANGIVAISKGVEFVDSTILGMGRGAGNLKTELLLTYLNKQDSLEVDFNALGSVVSAFTPLHHKCQWGTNLPYMISGANSFQQKEVMAWVSNRAYSFNSIVRALSYKKDSNKKDTQFPILEAPVFKDVLIVGGGENAIIHIEGIKEFIKQKANIAIIHATTRNAKSYQDIAKQQYFCLVGSEAERMKIIFKNLDSIQGECILSPSPRSMGTDIPAFMENKTYELSTIDFTKQAADSCTAVALQLALNLKAKNIYIVGYDGYPNGLSQKEMDLSKENKILIDNFKKYCGVELISITPTLYEEMTTESLYTNI